MKKIFVFLTLFLSCFMLFACNEKPVEPETPEVPENPEPEEPEVVISDRIIYVSPNGKGNEGTKENPSDFNTAVIMVEAGETILLAEVSYSYNFKINLTKNGVHNGRITLKPEVEGSKVILDFSAQSFNSANRGVQLYGNYWTIQGIDFVGAGDNGLYICGNYNIIENCQFYNNRDSGLQLGRGYSEQTSIDEWPSNNLIRYCTSFNNYDDETLGENADGFAAKLTVGYGNIFDSCIAYRNSDDGWDLYGKEDSGNIGNVILYNCVAFENGFLAESHEGNNGIMTFNTTNGDGIGFKLGGSTMEGDVIVNNCVAFNNKLHGFGDNSNPGVIQMTNCTAFNNCIGLNEDGTVASVRGIPGNTNNSNNFDMARDTNSYNSYYGLLSYINNQVGYLEEDRNTDQFRGATAYSIFQTSYDVENSKEIYIGVREYMDASSYKGDVLAMPTEQFVLSDACFADLTPINAIGDKMFSIHEALRNADLSINLGDLLRLVDEDLLKFADGKPIGAVLNKTSKDLYEHPEFTSLGDDATNEEVMLQHAYDVLDVLTNKDAVYQDFELPVYLNFCEISWVSSNENVIMIEKQEKIGVSAAAYIFARVKSPSENTKVTLTATIHYGKSTMNKSFEVNILPRAYGLGSLISDKPATTFIVGRYQAFQKPVITVTDASSVTYTALDPDLYELEVTYDYALERGGNYIEVNDIYTSVPGVFRVTTKAISKVPSDNGKTLSYEYFVFIGDDDCEIDFNGGIHNFTLNAEGFNISATLTNITGRIYVTVVPKDVKLFTPEEVMNHENVQVGIISSDKLNHNFIADNSSKEGYTAYYVISDRSKNNTSGVYSKAISATTISTKEEFYNLAQGITKSSNSVIYHLTTDLDFTDFEWADAENPDQFVGTFNGNGHTISNVTINSAIQKQANIFYKLVGGTIMNTNFTNISITNTASSGKLVGIVGAMNGGYISHINLTNVSSRAIGISAGSVGGMVGQIINGVNYIDHVTLVNDENQEICCTNKYAGGIVGNIQLDSNMVEAKVYVSYCVVKANIGNGKDSGGCTAGIIGRVKNDKDTYYTEVNNCYYKGNIISKGNYNGGIVGSFESGVGLYSINNNFADVVFIYGPEALVLDAKVFNALEEELEQEYAHKNCNPIVGRANSLHGRRLGDNNVGSWKEYYKDVILSQSLYFMNGPDYVPTATYFESACGWDLTKWNISDNGDVSLK